MGEGDRRSALRALTAVQTACGRPMEQHRDPSREYAKELLWAALMVNVIMALVGVLVGSHLGSLWLGLGLFLGGGLVITAILALVVLANAAIVWVLDRRHARQQNRLDQ